MTKDVYLELVPLDQLNFSQQLQELNNWKFAIRWVNIPHTRKCFANSVHATIDARRVLWNWMDILPHIRAREFVSIEGTQVIASTEKTDALIEKVRNNWLSKLLLVQWDSWNAEDVWWDNPQITLKFLEYLKSRLWSDISLYTAIDQYRWKDEHSRIQEKSDSGSDGFFTQPFFSKKELEEWMNRYHSDTLYYWLSPVVWDKAKSYWERVNRVAFPQEFETTEDYNLRLARILYRAISTSEKGCYLMPIKFPVIKYLSSTIQGQ